MSRNFNKIPANNRIEFRNNIIKAKKTGIDTTFSMYRYTDIIKCAVPTWNAFRLMAPYNCRHLDWYITKDNITDDYKYYMKTRNANITHWTNFDTLIRKCILVIGNHRSGTSSLTGLIYNSMDNPFDLGKHIMKGDKFNKNGYFENNDIMKINEAILHKMKTDWRDVNPITDLMMGRMMQCKPMLIKAINRTYDKTRHVL